MTFSVKGVDGGYIIYYNNIRYQKKLLKSCKRVREGHSYGKKRDVYKNMEELGDDLFVKSMEYFSTYYEEFPKLNNTPFVNLGLAYIRFSQEEQNLFRLLFLSENRHGKSLYDMLNGKNGAVVREINSAKIFGCKDPSGMFMKMWIFIHGAACMTLTGDYDLQEEDTIKLLEESYNAFQNV